MGTTVRRINLLPRQRQQLENNNMFVSDYEGFATKKLLIKSIIIIKHMRHKVKGPVKALH